MSTLSYTVHDMMLDDESAICPLDDLDKLCAQTNSCLGTDRRKFVCCVAIAPPDCSGNPPKAKGSVLAGSLSVEPSAGSVFEGLG